MRGEAGLEEKPVHHYMETFVSSIYSGLFSPGFPSFVLLSSLLPARFAFPFFIMAILRSHPGERTDLPNKGLGVKIGTMIGKIEARHGVQIVGALEIAERERARQIRRHGHGVEALHGEGRFQDGHKGEKEERGEKRGEKKKISGEEAVFVQKEEERVRVVKSDANGFGEKWIRGFCGERRRIALYNTVNTVFISGLR